MVYNSRENMIATLWLLTLTLITANECVYAAPSLVEYRRSEDSTPFGIQDDYLIGDERSKRLLSVMAPVDALRKHILLMQLRQRLQERDQKIAINREVLNSVGKRSKSLEREYYEPYKQHLDLGILIRALADANHQSYNVPADTAFDKNNGIETYSRYPLQNMHFNVDDDDRFIDLNDERTWLHEKQQRLLNQKQQRLNEQNKNILRQWDNKQLNDRTQVPSSQAQQQHHHHQQQQDNQQQKQQRQPDNSQQPIKSLDNDERFMLQTFDTK